MLSFSAPAADKLTVYTYESFTAEWGPGPQVEKAFEAECSCDLEFVAVADGVALLNRVRLEGQATKADIVLGLDTNLTAEAKQTGLFAPHGPIGELDVPGGWKDDVFLPYDYGYFAVVYNTETLKSPPKSLKELVEGDPEEKIVLAGSAHLDSGSWVGSLDQGRLWREAGEAWAKLKKRVLTVTPGWSESYGLFTKGEAPMVLSYTTSPAYHMISEKTDKYQAAPFAEGQYMQIEVAGVTVNGAKNPLSEKFMAFMISPAFQQIIPETNWMLPAGPTDQPLDPVFDRLVKPSKSLLMEPGCRAAIPQGMG